MSLREFFFYLIKSVQEIKTQKSLQEKTLKTDLGRSWGVEKTGKGRSKSANNDEA